MGEGWEGDWKKILQRRNKKKECLQSELHFRAYKLHPPEGHLAAWLVEYIHSPDICLQLR